MPVGQVQLELVILERDMYDALVSSLVTMKNTLHADEGLWPKGKMPSRVLQYLKEQEKEMDDIESFYKENVHAVEEKYREQKLKKTSEPPSTPKPTLPSASTTPGSSSSPGGWATRERERERNKWRKDDPSLRFRLVRR